MTSYYKGNNIGLNYDAANATWSFTNEPNDFIDPDSFSTAEPAFDYTPPPSTDDDDQDDDFNPCPAGYIYDNTLKQCVPDPNYQAAGFLGEPGGGGPDQPQATRVEFDASTPEGRKAMYEHGLEHGYFTTDTSKGGAYEFQGAKKAPFWTGVWGQFGENSEYNRYINELAKEDAKRKAAGQPPILAQAIGFFGLSKSFVDEQKPVFGDITSQFNKNIQNFKTATLASKISDYRYAEDQEEQISIDTERAEKARKAKYDADISKAKAEELQEQIARKQEQDQKERRDEIRDEYKDKGVVTYSTKDTGGYVTIPNEPSKPPTERQGYTGYTPPSEPSGGRPHGNPMGVQQSKPSRRQSGPKPGEYGWQR